MDTPNRFRPDKSPLWLIAAIASFVIGGLFAFAGRVLGIEEPTVLGALALIGAGIQALVLIGWYLHFTRPRPPLQHWFVAPSQEPAPYKRWPELPLAGDSDIPSH